MTRPDRNSIAFIFPGQGSQSVGMGRELAAIDPVAQQTFDQADAALNFKLSRLCFAGPEDQLKLTEVTQPAILTVSVAAFRVLQKQGVSAGFAAGHSLGEYSAHVAAGSLSFEDAVRVVHKRGKYMQEAVPVGTGAMAAILGMSLVQVRKLCQQAAHGQVCVPANINSPDQIVISGNTEAVQRAVELARERGAKRAIMLQVSAPFHCSLLQPAQERMAQELAELRFHSMTMPVVTNADAELVNTPEQARAALIRQVTAPVDWERSMRVLMQHGVKTFIELGPGKVLCGLMRQIDRSRNCLHVEDEGSLHKVVSHFAHAETGAF